MARVLLIAMVVLLTIYCVVEVAQSNGDEVRNAPRWLWAVAVICLPVVGPVAWLLIGRPTALSKHEADRERHPQSPDDDEDFLRNLGKER